MKSQMQILRFYLVGQNPLTVSKLAGKVTTSHPGSCLCYTHLNNPLDLYYDHFDRGSDHSSLWIPSILWTWICYRTFRYFNDSKRMNLEYHLLADNFMLWALDKPTHHHLFLNSRFWKPSVSNSKPQAWFRYMIATANYWIIILQLPSLWCES